MSNFENPYAAPESGSHLGDHEDGQKYPLARRLTRLGAQIADGLITVVLAIPGIGVMIATMENGEVTPIGLVAVGLNVLAVQIYQWVLLSNNGQTMGKKLAKVKVVDFDDGSVRGFWRFVGLRIWVPQLIGAIPVVGPLFGLVDTLMIFSEERRCLHDRIANTQVIDVS